MENPQTGLLKDQDVVFGIPYYDVDYCMYSDFGYKKRTRIWTTKDDFNPKLCNKKCGNMEGLKHKKSCGNSSYKTTNLYERYRVPELLIKDLFV